MKRSSGWLRRSIPRRMIHAIKVGLSLTLASLLYLMEPLFEGIGKNAIWAVMTVVVVLEFTAGETSFKCLNMGLGTVLAGTVAFLIEFIATKSGKIFQVVFFEATVFVIGAAATYTRFFPYLKKNYDSGILIFLSTFNLIIVSRYQDKNVLNIAHDQLYIIAIGCAACLFMSILALYASWEPSHSRHCYRFPWQQHMKVGDVLRQFGYTVVALQTEIQVPGSVRALFKDPCIRLAGQVTNALMELANNIRNRRHCSPGILSDHLHEAVQELNTAIKSLPRLFLGSNNNQATDMLALAAAHAARQNKQEKDVHGVSLSSVKTNSSGLMEWKTKRVSEQAKHRRSHSAPEVIENEKKVLRPHLSKTAITNLEFSEALPFASFASLLVEIVARLDNVIKEVEELGRIACYKEYNLEDNEIVVKCETPPVDVTKNQLPIYASD